NYLMRLRWFGGKGRGLEHIRIKSHARIPAAENSIVILLLEVSYKEGLPDMFQLPVAFGKGEIAVKLKERCPQSVISLLNVNGEEGTLYDAIYGIDYQQAIIEYMARNERIALPAGELVFSGSDVLKQHLSQQEKIRPKVISAEQSNTSITYDNAFYL